jgi:hypothetical protein
MPIAREDHRKTGTREFFAQAIERSKHLIAAAHSESAAGTKVILHIDDDERIFRHRKSL